MAGRPVRISILANGTAARSEFTKTGAAANTMGTRFKEAAGAATGMGKTFERVAKLGAAVFVAERVGHYGAEFVKQATQFQSATNLLVTAGGEAQSAIKGVSDGILKISGQTGTSADDLAEGMYTIEKAGYRAAAGLNVLKASAEGARAENVDMATMTNAVTSIMTSYHAKASDAVNITNELVAASGAAKTDMQAYAGSLASVLPSASAAGISFAQVGGAIATLTQHGTSAQEATQELANTIRNLAAPNQVASKEMQQLGVNVTDVSKNLGKRGLTGTLNLLVNAITKNMGKSGLVLLDAFRKSQSAGADLQTMIKSMPPDLAKLSQSYLDGSTSLKDYRNDIKSFGGSAAAMGTQFLSLVQSSQGFNQLLTSGSPAAQTFTDALKRMLGGATGMNTALQLSGENMVGFKARVDEISKAAKKGGDDISTWAKTSHNLSVQFDRVEQSIKNLGIKALLPVLPKISNGFANIADELNQSHPALKATANAVGDILHAGGDLPGWLKKDAVEVALLAVAWRKFNLAADGGILTRLAASVTGIRAPFGQMRADVAAMSTEYQGLNRVQSATLSLMSGTTGPASRVRASFAGIGVAARQAAGIGGVLALSQGIGRASTAMGALETTAGGAALGFSLGGPWGAAIGGAAGLAVSLAKGLGRTNNAIAANKALITVAAPTTEDYKATVKDLASSFDDLTGKITKATRAEVADKIVKSGVMSTLGKYGVTLKQVEDAMLGVGKGSSAVDAAQAKLNDQWGKDQLQINGLSAALKYRGAAYDHLTQSQLQALASAAGLTKAERDQLLAMGPLTEAQQKQVKAKIANLEADQQNQVNAQKQLKAIAGETAAAKQQWQAQQLAQKGYIGTKKALDALPKTVETRITTKGLAGTIADAKTIASTYNGLTAKDYKIILKAEGIDASKKNIQALVDAARHAASQSGSLGSSAGSSFGSGYVGGISKWTGPAREAAAAMANAAHAAAMRAQDSHSPSKKAAQLGRWYVEGYAIGLSDTTALARVATGAKKTVAAAGNAASKAAKRSGSALVKAMLAGISSGDLSGAFGKIESQIDKAITGKHQTKRQKAVLKSLKPQENALQGIAKQYDAIMSGSNTFGDGVAKAAKLSKGLEDEMAAIAKLSGQQVNNLQDARQALTALQQQAEDYATSIHDTVVATGDITQLGINQATGTASLSGILADLTKQVAQAQKFQADINALTAAGLNNTSLQQLLAAGPSALSTADAILSGGQSAIGQINALAGQLDAVGTNLGNDMANKFYGAGVNAAQGLVNGLQSQLDAVDTAGTKLAKKLIKAMKKALKINSPSRVFKQIGVYSVQGLDAGFDDARIKRIGTTAAGTLVKSFGTPALQAYMKGPAAASQSPVPVHVKISPDGVNQLLLGRTVTQAQDAYLGPGGGRRRAS